MMDMTDVPAQVMHTAPDSLDYDVWYDGMRRMALYADDENKRMVILDSRDNATVAVVPDEYLADSNFQVWLYLLAQIERYLWEDTA